MWRSRHRIDRCALQRRLLESDTEKQFWRSEIEGDGTLIFEFQLAEQMSCTVAEMRQRVSAQEFQQWIGFRSYVNKKAEMAHKAALAEAKKGG